MPLDLRLLAYLAQAKKMPDAQQAQQAQPDATRVSQPPPILNAINPPMMQQKTQATTAPTYTPVDDYIKKTATRYSGNGIEKICNNLR